VPSGYGIKNMLKRLIPVTLAFCLCGCAHYLEKDSEVAAMEYAADYSRTGTHAAADKATAPAAREKDDFIDVDDNKALRKSWPMALFIGLLAAAVGML